MKVKKLKSLLKDIPDNAEIVLASDSEGNSFHTLSDIQTGLFLVRDEYDEISVFDKEDLEDYLSEEERDVEKAKCVVFWP